jgi:hypothetical protein
MQSVILARVCVSDSDVAEIDSGIWIRSTVRNDLVDRGGVGIVLDYSSLD